MSNTLNWYNPNTLGLTNIEVWSSPTKAGTYAKIATLDPTAVTYEDTSVARNTITWYKLVAVINTQRKESVPFCLGFFPDSGPGPANLLRGTWEFGYFGEVAASDLPTYGELEAATGITKNTTQPTVFLKWIVNGRIIFIPDVPFSTTATDDQIKASKLTWPVNGDVSGGRTLDKGAYRFSPRLPFGTTLRTTAPASMEALGSAEQRVSELAALLSMISNFDNAATTYFSKYKFGDLTAANANGGYIFTGSYMPFPGNPLYLAGFAAQTTFYNASPSTNFSRTAWVIYDLIF